MRKAKGENSRWKVSVHRYDPTSDKKYIQTFTYENLDKRATVASMLAEVNDRGDVVDETGQIVSDIGWDCSCLQKKCGACAMVIDGMPRLACDAFLRDYEGTIEVKPLGKFKLVRDLIVDRSVMWDNLKKMKLWSDSEIPLSERKIDDAYEASRCLQCGCCLEVCPNFSVDETFYGAASFVPTTRIIASQELAESKEIRKLYKAHGQAGCGKSLACQNICPARIDITRLLVKSNHLAFVGTWHDVIKKNK